MVLDAIGLLLPLNFYGLLDNADKLTIFFRHLFAIYGCYGGFIFFNSSRRRLAMTDAGTEVGTVNIAIAHASEISRPATTGSTSTERPLGNSISRNDKISRKCIERTNISTVIPNALNMPHRETASA